MIFRSIARASLTTQFDIRVVLTTLAAVLAVFALTWFAVGFIRVARRGQRGTIVQSSFHGNIGYIALAVAFYALGNEGLVRTSIIAAFVMILQNLLAIFILQYYSDKCGNQGKHGPCLSENTGQSRYSGFHGRNPGVSIGDFHSKGFGSDAGNHRRAGAAHGLADHRCILVI